MKKRLAFSCAGEGFGHISRIVALSEPLRDHFDLVYFVPKSVQDFLFQHLGMVPVVTIPSFHFVLKDHRVDYLATAKKNKSLFWSHKIRNEIKEQLTNMQVDALLSDFEPFASRAASDIGIPVLNLNHPGIVLKTFSLSFNGIASQLVAHYMIPPSQKTLFCSFYNGEVGPIIRQEIKNSHRTKGDYYLVYTKKDSREKILNCLKKFPELKFDIYPREDGNFARALCRCKGVIAPAGHQLLSEALYLGKPVLAFPQKNQYEQKVNARMLEKSGYGIHGRLHSMKQDMNRFFSMIDELPKKRSRFERFKFKDDTDNVVNMVINFVHEQTKGAPTKLYRYSFIDSIKEKIDIVYKEINGLSLEG